MKMVIGLRKGTYGLAQFWHAKLCSASFSQCGILCLYCKHDEKNTVLVGFYVDDLLATDTGAAAVDHFLPVCNPIDQVSVIVRNSKYACDLVYPSTGIRVTVATSS